MPWLRISEMLNFRNLKKFVSVINPSNAHSRHEDHFRTKMIFQTVYIMRAGQESAAVDSKSSAIA